MTAAANAQLFIKAKTARLQRLAQPLSMAKAAKTEELSQDFCT